MTIKDCIDIVDNQKPNQYSIRDKVMWLSFLDEGIINDVLKTHEGYDGRYDLFTGYSEDKLSETLIAPSPYDRVYTQYLKMKIDEENGETARYNNSMVLYNSYMQEYRKYYNKLHMPIDATKKEKEKKPATTQMGVTDAQFDGLVKELTFVLTEYFSETVSEDKIYDAASKYIQNNWQKFVGKDGKTPVLGVDYFTEEDKKEIVDFVREEMDKVLPEAKKYTDQRIGGVYLSKETAVAVDNKYELDFVKEQKFVSEVVVFDDGDVNYEYHMHADVYLHYEDGTSYVEKTNSLLATYVMKNPYKDKQVIGISVMNGDSNYMIVEYTWFSKESASVKEYVDNSINRAILDSWEVGV